MKEYILTRAKGTVSFSVFSQYAEETPTKFLLAVEPILISLTPMIWM